MQKKLSFFVQLDDITTKIRMFFRSMLLSRCFLNQHLPRRLIKIDFLILCKLTSTNFIFCILEYIAKCNNQFCCKLELVEHCVKFLAQRVCNQYLHGVTEDSMSPVLLFRVHKKVPACFQFFLQTLNVYLSHQMCHINFFGLRYNLFVVRLLLLKSQGINSSRKFLRGSHFFIFFWL